MRTRGGHRYLRHRGGRGTVVPVHAGEDVGRGLLAKILRDVELAEAELRKFL
ncbi:MAG: type II toxin-antitoxin system HicA family toxin [Rhodanobacteraceae bacterium]